MNMKQHQSCRTGFTGKDGNTYLLSEVNKETNTVLLKVKETGEYKEISFDQWYIYECKKLLKSFET
jgi:hypothetical protein